MSDPTEAERRQRATIDLQYVLCSYDWHPQPEIVAAIVEWHLRCLTEAKTETWVPGMAGSSDPKVEEILQKYYTHRVRSTIDRLTAENVRLKQQILEVVDCLKYYASGTTDGGKSAIQHLHQSFHERKQHVRREQIVFQKPAVRRR